MTKKISITFLMTFLIFTLTFALVSFIYFKNLDEILNKEHLNAVKNEVQFKVENTTKLLNNLKKDIFYMKNLYKKNQNKFLIQDQISYMSELKDEYILIQFIDKINNQHLNISKEDTDEIRKTNIEYKNLTNMKENELFITMVKKSEKYNFFDVITKLFDKNNNHLGYLIVSYDMKNIFDEFYNTRLKLSTAIYDNNNLVQTNKNQSLYTTNYSININFSKLLNQDAKLSSQDLKIVSYINDSIVERKKQNYINTVAWIMFLYFLISTIISYIFAEYKTRQQIQKDRLKISNSIFENSHDGVVITDRNNKIIQVNKAFSKITGYSEKEVLKKTPRILKANGVHTKQFYKELWEGLSSNNFWEGEITNKRKDGSHYTEDLSISKIITEDQNIFYIASFIDLTENKKNKKIIENKLQENKTYLEIINDYLITLKVDLNGKIIDVSDAFCSICGYSKKELIGNNHNIFRHPDTSKEFYLNIWKDIYSHKTWEGELKNIKKNGDIYYVHTKMSPIVNSNNEIKGYASIAIDITDKKLVEKLSITDELTKTYNRRFFNDTIEKEIARAKRDKKNIGFAILDIDFFKQYNDTYGHNKGDKALIEVANTLKNNASRASDYIFRLGGEEFGVLVFDINIKQFELFLEKLRLSIENLKIEHKASDISNVITSSFGGVLIDSKVVTAEKLYKDADKLLYKAKDEGRNKIFVEEKYN